MASLEAQYQAGTAEYSKLQADYSKAVAHRQRLDAQQSESQAVQKEFANLTPDNSVYKLVGPVLLKQDPAEAKANVEKRLQFINSEIERVEGNLKELDTNLDKKKMDLVHIQTQLKQKQETQQQLLTGAGAEVKSTSSAVAV